MGLSCVHEEQENYTEPVEPVSWSTNIVRYLYALRSLFVLNEWGWIIIIIIMISVKREKLKIKLCLKNFSFKTLATL